MSAIENHLNLHAQALQLRERRNGVLASNIANAATPGFKARDMDFKAELSQAIGAGQLKTTSEGHIPVGGTGAAGMLYRKPTTSSLDGNTVEIAVEQMEFAQNTLRYQSSLEFLNRKIRGLTRAIKGE